MEKENAFTTLELEFGILTDCIAKIDVTGCFSLHFWIKLSVLKGRT